MGIVIGIDVGGSTTKIVGQDARGIFSPLMVKASDPNASIFGAFGRFLFENSLSINDVSRVMITGVGSSALDGGKIYGIQTEKVDEFRATGLGGLMLSGLNKAIIVSMGTGTAIVSAEGASARHVGGTGVGGGTLLGLSNKMLNIRSFDALVKASHGGKLSHVDLFVSDITAEKLPTLPEGTTASNFGKLSDLATRSDIAYGIINLVFQTIGTTAAFASKLENTKKIVLTGTLTNVPAASEIFKGLEPLYDVEFIIPPTPNTPPRPAPLSAA
jgi:type II pantothenate kinase